MTRINKIGLLMALLALIVVIMLYASYIAVKRTFFSDTPTQQESVSEEQTDTVEQQIASASDRDGDGLPDLIENIYRSNPDVADTDGDGTNDGDEVAQQRDPTLPGPNDQFIVDKDPNTNTEPNYTDRYIATLPEDADRDTVLDDDTVQAFIESVRQEVITRPENIQIETTTATNQEAIVAYLDQISSIHNRNLIAVSSSDIEAAFRLHYSQQQSSQLQQIITYLQNNVDILQAVPAPEPVADLHRRLIAISDSLLINTTLLQNMPNDFIGGLIGARNIEALGEDFQAIGAEVSQLSPETTPADTQP